MTLPDDNVRLESLIAAAPQAVDGRVEVMQQALRTTLVVASAVAAERWQDISPVLLTTGEFRSVAVFTSGDAMQSLVGDRARFALTVPGEAVVRQLDPSLGIAVAAPRGMVVFDPHLLAKVRADIAGGPAPDA